MLCLRLITQVRASVTPVVWFRVTEAVPSDRLEKLVKEIVGGPYVMGTCEVPAIPRSPATLLVYAKNGEALLLFRLKLKVRLFCKRGLKLCVKAADALIPVPLPVSRNPKGVSLEELRSWNCTLNERRFLLFRGALRRTPMFCVFAGLEVTSR